MWKSGTVQSNATKKRLPHFVGIGICYLHNVIKGSKMRHFVCARHNHMYENVSHKENVLFQGP